MRSRVIPVLIILVLIIAVGSVTAISLINNYRKGSTEVIDFKEDYGLEDNEYLVVLNNEIQTFKGIEDSGTVYIDAENVAKHINDRFYWDSNEKIFIYTKATQVIKAFPDQQSYSVGGENTPLDYAPIKTIGDTVYVSVEYIKLFTQCEIEAYQDPNRLMVTTKWGELQTVSVQEDTVMRYTDPYDEADTIDLHHPIVKNVAAGESLNVVQREDGWNWTKVATNDGYVGWIENRYLGEIQTASTTAPAFEEEQFTYLKEEGKICLAWHQVTTQEASSVNNLIQALNNTSDITVVAPTWFCFDGTEGHINSIASYDYVSYAHQVGKKVWAVFQNSAYSGGEMDGINTDNILSYTSKRETLVNELIAAVLEYGIDGINLDFEMITEDGADNYIQFVRELSVACRNNGITFSIDNYVPLYTKHYDRTEQARFADYLVIMGYDEYGQFSMEAGPVASVPFVKQGIEDTLELIGGDSSKVINGIPFYTVVWNETVPYEDTISMPTAKEYLQKYPDSTVLSWNSELGYNYGYYTSALNGVTYSMWLEDKESIAAKLELMNQYDLAGVALWKLQQETGDVWPAISAYINGEQIPTHEVLQEQQNQQ
ncbi:MAG: hypothetical protein KHX56_16225 [Clostridiales bacterium]|nr:hypothetical protein [Clostridiales bacterium]